MAVAPSLVTLRPERLVRTVDEDTSLDDGAAIALVDEAATESLSKEAAREEAILIYPYFLNFMYGEPFAMCSLNPIKFFRLLLKAMH